MYYFTQHTKESGFSANIRLYIYKYDLKHFPMGKNFSNQTIFRAEIQTSCIHSWPDFEREIKSFPMKTRYFLSLLILLDSKP